MAFPEMELRMLEQEDAFLADLLRPARLFVFHLILPSRRPSRRNPALRLDIPHRELRVVSEPLPQSLFWVRYLLFVLEVS